MYKLLAKVLAGRLKRVMAKVISENQNAFLSGRNILDGVVVVNEVIDLAKRAKKQCLILKVDFQKAYDTICWDYLEYMMTRMGFCAKWRNWMSACVSSSSISVLVNGSPTDEFSAQKGLKQGDPLAPFLFLIAAEGLAGLVRKGEEAECLEGFKVDDNLSISMLQFADDTIFLCDGKEKSVWCLKVILRSFELVSGLKVNFAKSNIVGLNMEERVVNGISSFLACKIGAVPFKFLGVPVGANPRRMATWQAIIDSIKARLSKWRSINLSIGGRVTLINSVLSSLPLYMFSMFKAPKKVINEIVKLQRRFLWGGDEEKKKLAWVKWENICKPKQWGGLVIKDLNMFNLALVAKWRWRLLVDDDNHLWKRVLTSRYGRVSSWNGELPTANTAHKLSLWWRDLLILGEGTQLEKGWFNSVTKMKMGNGSRTKFWTDKWLGPETLADLFPTLLDACGGAEVAVAEMGRWHDDGWEWDWGWSEAAVAVDFEAAAALSDLLRDIQPLRDVPDRWIWLPESIRGYTVKSCYDWINVRRRGIVLVNEEPKVEACSSLWRSDLPSKTLIFSWRLLMDKLPTREKLFNRGILTSTYEMNCVFCFGESENVEHVFCSCPIVQAVWRGVFGWVNVGGGAGRDVLSIFNELSGMVYGNKKKRVKHIFWVATVWQIWLARNRTIFQGVVVNVNSVVNSIKYVSWCWLMARKGRNSGLTYSD